LTSSREESIALLHALELEHDQVLAFSVSSVALEHVCLYARQRLSGKRFLDYKPFKIVTPDPGVELDLVYTKDLRHT
jgi:hypothetical protein